MEKIIRFLARQSVATAPSIFAPKSGKSNFSLSALGEMTTLDGFWAARIIASFSPEQIRAMVETAEYSRSKDTEYLVNQILARQSIIARYYFNKRAGFERFSVNNEEAGACLNFQDIRLRFPVEERVNEVYEYRVVTPGKKPQILSKGTVTAPKITFDDKLLKTIAGIGNRPQNRGVARLVLKRKGEKQGASVYLWSKDGSDLEIAGIVH